MLKAVTHWYESYDEMHLNPISSYLKMHTRLEEIKHALYM